MLAPSAAILNVGLVTSVGLTAPASCAAIRAGLTNPSPTRVPDAYGDWIQAHQVPAVTSRSGRARLAELAQMAIEECLEGSDRRARERMSVLLCVAEPSRPGRIAGLEELLADIQRSLGVTFASDSAVLAGGRVGVCQALARARELLSLREAQ